MAQTSTVDSEINPALFGEEDLGSLLRRVSDLFSRAVRAEFTNGDSGPLRAKHEQILIHVDLDGVRISEIARRSGLTKQTVGARTKAMVGLGLVATQRDPSDGRAKLVKLTVRGVDFLFVRANIVRDTTLQFTELVGQRRMTQLHSALKTLLKKINSD